MESPWMVHSSLVPGTRWSLARATLGKTTWPLLERVVITSYCLTFECGCQPPVDSASANRGDTGGIPGVRLQLSCVVAVLSAASGRIGILGGRPFGQRWAHGSGRARGGRPRAEFRQVGCLSQRTWFRLREVFS